MHKQSKNWSGVQYPLKMNGIVPLYFSGKLPGEFAVTVNGGFCFDCFHVVKICILHSFYILSVCLWKRVFPIKFVLLAKSKVCIKSDFEFIVVIMCILLGNLIVLFYLYICYFIYFIYIFFFHTSNAKKPSPVWCCISMLVIMLAMMSLYPNKLYPISH